MPHSPEHPLGRKHFRTKNWFYCGQEGCYFVVCGDCREPTCVCNMTKEEIHEKNQHRLMRGREKKAAPRAQEAFASSAALAVWDDDEVACDSTEEQEPPEGGTRPQEGHASMADKDEETKVDKRTDAAARRGKGELEKLVVEVTDAFEGGKIELPEGKLLTPQRIATIIGEKKGEDKPSAGAVASILKRWEDAGYALVNDKPYSFKRVSARGRKEGLDTLKEKLREKRKAERQAEREAKKAAAEEAETKKAS